MVLRKSRFGGMSKNVKIGGIIVVVVVSFIVIFIIYKTILRLKEQKKIDKKWKEILKERAIYDEKMSEREKENIRYMNEESPIKATQAEYDAEIKENDLLIKDKYKTQLIVDGWNTTIPYLQKQVIENDTRLSNAKNALTNAENAYKLAQDIYNTTIGSGPQTGNSSQQNINLINQLQNTIKDTKLTRDKAQWEYKTAQDIVTNHANYLKTSQSDFIVFKEAADKALTLSDAKQKRLIRMRKYINNLNEKDKM